MVLHSCAWIFDNSETYAIVCFPNIVKLFYSLSMNSLTGNLFVFRKGCSLYHVSLVLMILHSVSTPNTNGTPTDKKHQPITNDVLARKTLKELKRLEEADQAVSKNSFFNLKPRETQFVSSSLSIATAP